MRGRERENKGRREAAVEEKREIFHSVKAVKAFVSRVFDCRAGSQAPLIPLVLTSLCVKAAIIHRIHYSISSHTAVLALCVCVNFALPSHMHSVYFFLPDGHGCNVVYQASPELRSDFAIYPKVLPSDLSATMEIKLSHDISFSRVRNGPLEARGYTFFQQHIKNQKKKYLLNPFFFDYIKCFVCTDCS